MVPRPRHRPAAWAREGPSLCQTQGMARTSGPGVPAPRPGPPPSQPHSISVLLEAFWEPRKFQKDAWPRPKRSLSHRKHWGASLRLSLPSPPHPAPTTAPKK